MKSDALHPAAQLTGRSRVISLEEPVRHEEGSEEPLLLGEVLASEAEDPAETGARNLDWQAFMATLDELARAILDCLAQGQPLMEVGLAFGLSRSTIQSRKNRLSQALAAFMGPELLQQLQRPPQWRLNLLAVREKLARNDPLNIFGDQRQQTSLIAAAQCCKKILHNLNILLCAHKFSPFCFPLFFMLNLRSSSKVS
jgi:hypothetical protein